MKIFSDEGAPLDALRISHPENRIPKDSGELFNDIFNRAMEKKFGIADIRRKTVFASGSVNQAKLYGQIFYFFPIGDFKFTYAPDVEDSYEEGRKLWQKVMENQRKQLNKKQLAKLWKDLKNESGIRRSHRFSQCR